MLDTIEKANLIDTAIDKWRNFPYSALTHHGQDCCQIAREWFLAMDFAQLSGADKLTAPRWIRQKYTWGPCSWSLHWCEAVRRKTLDCGALAAMSHEVFLNRGVKSYPVQLIQKFNADAVNQWQTKWNNDECSAHWLENELIYHEGCAVSVGKNEIKIWDASAGWWINTNQPEGYGSLMAVRIFAHRKPEILKWGTHWLTTNIWQKVNVK